MIKNPPFGYLQIVSGKFRTTNKLTDKDKIAMTLEFNFTDHKRQIKSLRLTGWIIWALEKIYGATTLDSKLEQLRTLEKGTVGREVAEMLDEKGYRLIPKFENHDLKHIVLDYEMTMQDEIKMHSYLVGN